MKEFNEVDWVRVLGAVVEVNVHLINGVLPVKVKHLLLSDHSIFVGIDCQVTFRNDTSIYDILNVSLRLPFSLIVHLAPILPES